MYNSEIQDDMRAEEEKHGRRILERFSRRAFVSDEVATALIKDVSTDVAVRADHRQLHVEERSGTITTSIPVHQRLLATHRPMDRRYGADPDGFTHTTIEYVEHDPSRRTCVTCNGAADVVCPRCAGTGEIQCRTCGGDGQNTCSRCGAAAMALGWATEKVIDTDLDLSGTGRIDCDRCGGNGVVTRTINRRVERDVGSEYEETITEKRECPRCENGSVQCPRCDGRGTTPCTDCAADYTEICPECNGSAEIECRDCAGRGVVLEPTVGVLEFTTETWTEIDSALLDAETFEEDWTHTRTVPRRDASSGDVGGAGLIRWIQELFECRCTRVEYLFDGVEYAVIDVDGRLVTRGDYPKSTLRKAIPIIIAVVLFAFGFGYVIATQTTLV